MNYLRQAHSDFVKKAISSAQITDNAFTAIPTFFCLLTSFILFYQHLHRTNTIHTRWKTRITRDLKFHWIYFNGTRLWFILIACIKRLVTLAEEFVENNIPDKNQEFNISVTTVTAVIITTSLAILPTLLLYANYAAHSEMPNFLMWVMEDPYLRHEIGISGHCLERPLRIDDQKLKNYPYRSKRSTSFDNYPWIATKSTNLCRSCKSMIEHNVVKSIEDLLN